MSFRLKTILGIALIEGILLLVLIGSSLNFLQRSNHEEFGRRAYTTAVLFATLCKEAVISDDLASLESFVFEMLGNPGIVYARVLNDETVLAEDGEQRLLARPFSLDRNFEEVNDGVFDTFAEIRVGTYLFGRVELGLSTTSLQELVGKAKQRFFFIAALEIALVALFSFILGTYLTRSLTRLEQAAHTISSGGAGVQIEARGSDELAHTISAFNLMSRRLKSSYDDLHDSLQESRQLTLRLENELEERRAVENNLRKLSRAVEHSANVVFITNTEGVIEFINPAFTRITGYEAHEALGKTPRILRSGKTPEQTYKELWRTLKQGKVWQGEFLNRHKNGSFYWEFAVISPVRDETGTLTHYVAIEEDINLRKQAEEELKAARRAAEQANHAKTEFIANISHEIRTPLNAIQGFSDILRGRLRDKRDLSYLAAVQEAVKSLLALFSDVLDLAYMDMDKLTLHNSPVEFAAALNSAVRETESKFAGQGAQFSMDLDAALPSAVMLDEVRLQQVLHNLLSGAFKFMNAEHIKVSAKVLEKHVDTIDFKLCLENAADGSLNPAPNSTQECAAAGSIKNLELTLARRLLERMGGSLSCYKSGRIEVRISGIALAPRLSKTDDALGVDKISFPQAHIIIMDDVPAGRAVIKEYLQHSEAVLLETDSSRQCFELAATRSPDLIIMNLRMPSIDTCAVLRQMKRLPALKNVPVLITTALPAKDIDPELGSLCDAVLHKPFSKEQLIPELMHFLDYQIQQRHSYNGTQDEAPGQNADASADPEMLKALLERLYKDFDKRRRDLGRHSTINDIEDFGRDLRQLGMEYDFPPLRDWGEALSSQAEMFNIPLLYDTLEQFPEILRGLEQRLKEQHKDFS